MGTLEPATPAADWLGDLKRITAKLATEAGALRFAPPVAHVYNPLDYARDPYLEYLARFGHPPKEAVFVGMNPGPFGMAQTGIPFGDVSAVSGWMGIRGEVGRPADEHPKRPVRGFACPRSEVSGSRLWGWARRRFGSAEAFFDRFFVANYCPLVFLEESGRNRTPDRLKRPEREPLFDSCDRALAQTVAVLEAPLVIGIGRFAEERARRALAATDVRIGRILHPSPANPVANARWSVQVEEELSALGLVLPATPPRSRSG